MWKDLSHRLAKPAAAGTCLRAGTFDVADPVFSDGLPRDSG